MMGEMRESLSNNSGGLEQERTCAIRDHRFFVGIRRKKIQFIFPFFSFCLWEVGGGGGCVWGGGGFFGLRVRSVGYVSLWLEVIFVARIYSSYNTDNDVLSL